MYSMRARSLPSVRPQRKRMTLIAAIPCKDGFVLAADSQETVPVWSDIQNDWVEYRRTVQKIDPRDMGLFFVVVAGSGNAALIDSFILVLERKLSGESGETLVDFVRYTEETLADFYARDVALCIDSDKTIKMFFAAVPKKGGECGLWVQKNVGLVPVTDAELIGWSETLYVNTMKRFYKPEMDLQQGILASIYVLIVAEETSNYVRGPMSVVIVRNSEMHMEANQQTKEMVDRLRDYEGAINALFLACAENTPHPIFERTLANFMEEAKKLHRFQGIMVSKLVAYAVLAPPNDSK